ncbi:MAG: flagellar biosynthesis anti-sigma factor FlgM [Phycisphaeraceae bacterium]|nr:flagellar biosynthesis anti-sigma factor FlgM [Phycisphaeraceae bacterium]
MSDIAPLSSTAASRLGPTGRITDREPADTPQRIARGEDRVDLSDVARYLQRTSEVPPMREELVNRIRQDIAAGTYDTADRLDQALDAMIDHLNSLPE